MHTAEHYFLNVVNTTLDKNQRMSQVKSIQRENAFADEDAFNTTYSFIMEWKTLEATVRNLNMQ